MQISGNKRIPPASIFLLALGSVQVQDQQILFRNSFHDRFAKAPCLHCPNRIRVKIVEEFVNGIADGAQIFRCIDRRLAFVERISRINAMRSVEFFFFFQEVTSDHSEQRIGRVQLRRPGETAPGRLQLYLGIRVFFFQLTRNIAGKSLLNGLHTQFQFPVDNLFSQNDMLVDPRFGERTSITLQVLHPLPCKMSRTGQEPACLFIRKLMLEKGIVPDCFQSDNRQRHINRVHCHKVKLSLPAFPIPPGSRVADRTIIHVDTIFAIDRVFNGDGHRQLLRQVQLIAEPGNMCITGVFQILVECRRQ